MAEGLLADALKAEEEPFCSYKVISSGIAAFDGEPASEHSVSALQEINIDLSNHKSQPVTQTLFQESDLILCMTETHRDFLKKNFSDKNKPIFLIRELIPNTTDIQIPDPFGGHPKHYKECRDSISEAIPGIIQYIKEQINPPTIISIGADHGGYELRQHFLKTLDSSKYKMIDRGAFSLDRLDDYPDFAKPVSQDIVSSNAHFGILICTTGIGMSISANKFPGVRAALIHSEKEAAVARQHNNANVLVLSAKNQTLDEAVAIAKIFINTPFEEGRHSRRINKINALAPSS